MKRDSSLIRTALPFRVVAHGGSWPHFYYGCLLLMISSKLVLKGPAAFKLSSSHFMAVRTPSQEKSVAVGKHAPKSSETPCTSSKPAASHGTCKEQGRSQASGIKQRNEAWALTGERQKSQWRWEEEGGNYSVSGITGLESQQQSI